MKENKGFLRKETVTLSVLNVSFKKEKKEV